MEKISEIIERLCPERVEKVKLVDCANVLYGFPFESSLFSEDEVNIPLIRIRDVVPGKASTYYAGEYQDEYLIHKGDILVGMDGNFNLAKWNDRDGLLNQRVCKISSKDNLSADGFLYHILGPIFKIIELNTAGGSVKHLSAKIINQIEIPLPPLPIQQEIVRILDSFTQLQSNLEAELAARQKQYEHYRDSLFSEDLETLLARTDCEIKTIGELGTLTRGKRFVRTDIVEHGVPCIHYGDMYTCYGLKAETANTHITDEKAKSMRFAKKGDVVIVGAGENDWDIGVGLVWLGKAPAAIHDACYILEHSQDPMYISHYLRSTVYHLQLRKYVSSGKISSFAAKDLAKIYIPIPSLIRQQEIVSILDTFEALISNIKNEIESRKKQYEYYREKLLTF